MSWVCSVMASCSAAAFVLAAVVPLSNLQGLGLPDLVSNRPVIGVHDIRLLADSTSTKRDAKWCQQYTYKVEVVKSGREAQGVPRQNRGGGDVK